MPDCHLYSDSNTWILDPSILRINKVHILFIQLHLPGYNNHTSDEHLQHPSVLRIYLTVLLLVCLQLPSIGNILFSLVLLVDGYLLLSDELLMPVDKLGQLVFKYLYGGGLHLQLETVLRDLQAVLL